MVKVKTALGRIQERKIVCYPKPRYVSMLTAESFLNTESKSERTKEIIKNYYERLSPKEQDKLLTTYREMTSNQRKCPKSF